MRNRERKIVHVIGTGTIGEPLIGLLVQNRAGLGIEEVTFHKRTPLLTDRSKVTNLVKRGARLAVDAERCKDFQDMGMQPSYAAEEALDRASVVIDCTPVGNDNKKAIYERYVDRISGFIAQGSEFGFGKPYARGINDQSLQPGEDRFLQVVSCNTHNLATIIDTLVFRHGDVANLQSGRFVCIRRANDISQEDDFIAAPQVDKHKDARFGTHHARDVFHLYKTLGVDLGDIFSSSIKVPSQYMHIIWFDVKLRRKTALAEIRDTITANDRLAVTYKSMASTVFSFGRDHGHFGRILNQTVFGLPTLHVSQDGTEVTGYCFTPQDGNALLSSVAGALWFLDPTTYEERIQCLKPYFFDEV